MKRCIFLITFLLSTLFVCGQMVEQVPDSGKFDVIQYQIFDLKVKGGGPDVDWKLSQGTMSVDSNEVTLEIPEKNMVEHIYIIDMLYQRRESQLSVQEKRSLAMRPFVKYYAEAFRHCPDKMVFEKCYMPFTVIWTFPKFEQKKKFYTFPMLTLVDEDNQIAIRIMFNNL